MRSDVVVYSATGIALIPARRQTVFRLAKPSYGPLNPRRRDISGTDDRIEWNRFDLPGEQTIYAASTPQGAYGELLGPLKKPRALPAAALLDDVGDATIEDLIANDWAQAGKQLPPYVVDLNWLYRFRLYTLTLPERGWLVELEHSATVAYLHGHIPASLWDRGFRRITVSDLRSEDRLVTTTLAEQVAAVQLDDGATALGLRYGSKHGSDWQCWTIWLRGHLRNVLGVDDGIPVAEPNENPALAAVLQTYNLCRVD